MNALELILKKPLHLNMKKSIQILPKDKKQMELVSKWLLENNIKFEEFELFESFLKLKLSFFSQLFDNP